METHPRPLAIPGAVATTSSGGQEIHPDYSGLDIRNHQSTTTIFCGRAAL